jgi:TetR/AcrR family transcriptional regulator
MGIYPKLIGQASPFAAVIGEAYSVFPGICDNQSTMSKANPVKPKRKLPGKRPPAATKPGRGRGRPKLAKGIVGRDTIVAAARALMERLPPHEATFSAIARKAGVDPALVRYYFTSREKLMLAVIESVIESWTASHPFPAAQPAARLASHVGDMLDFSRKMRMMQRLMVDECAGSKSADVRRRVRELNEGAVSFYRLLVHSEKHSAKNPTDPLFMFVAIIGMCEFFVAAQRMILPLAPEGMAAEELAARYKDFIIRMVLDGLRSHVEPWSPRPSSGP